MKSIVQIKKAALAEIKKAKDAKALEAARVHYLGRQDGELTKILRSLKDMSDAKKREIGPKANELRQELEAALNEKLKELQALSYKIHAVDITMPGRKVAVGHLHPLTLMENKIREIFLSLNFSVVVGPEVESEYYNFDALNIPANHPARDMWDTFWLLSESRVNGETGLRGSAAEPSLVGPLRRSFSETSRQGRESALLMRTHTSPMQIRYMERHQPPFQIIVPGRVFRFEATDASHEINFHQVEGLMVGPDVNLANFKYVITEFFRRLFGPHIEVRFRPSYFPFTEPSLEVDVKLGEKWLEVMGAGMVNPKVFEAVRYNPKNIQGFAFGLGLERLAMIKYHIPDIRMFYENDLRFIQQF